jgi:hypothetical protein
MIPRFLSARDRSVVAVVRWIADIGDNVRRARPDKAVPALPRGVLLVAAYVNVRLYARLLARARGRPAITMGERD